MVLSGGAPGEGEDFQKFQRIKDVSSKSQNWQQRKKSNFITSKCHQGENDRNINAIVICQPKKTQSAKCQAWTNYNEQKLYNSGYWVKRKSKYWFDHIVRAGKL